MAGRPARRVSPSTACSRLQWTRVVRLAPDAILLQPAIERAAAHAELLRGETHVPVVTREYFFDEHALGILERQLVRCLIAGSAGALEAEVTRRDRRDVGIRHEHRALDAVRQLADVAR